MRVTAAACALLSLALVRPSPQSQASRTLHRHFDPQDRESGRYQYVPIDVAPGTEALTISYRYSGADGANVIDLGVFEPGSLALGTSSFRGYSGGARRTITVGRNAASPGYRAGPLPPGEWHVLLGLYKVAAGGVDVDIDVTGSTQPWTGDERTSGAAHTRHDTAAPTAGPRWYSGALHLHTTHSDGSIAPGAVADATQAAGFDFIVITDHNNTTHTREAMPAAPLHIVGEEVTTPAGHAGVWGLPHTAWIDFRVRPGDAGAAAAINGLVAQAHDAGALFSINHPVDDCAGCSWEHVIPAALDAVEIWNGEKGPQQAAVAVWDRLLQTGRHVTAVGASDWHRLPARIDAPAVRVLAAGLTQAAILDGIRRGHVVVMRDARTGPPSVRASCGASVAAIGETLACGGGDTVTVRVEAADGPGAHAELFWNGSQVASKRIAPGLMFETPAAPGYLRVHVLAADGTTVAITNPVYVTTR